MLKPLIQRLSLYMVSSLLNGLLTFVLAAVYGHLLLPEVFGLVALTSSLDLTLGALLELGLSTATSKLYYETTDDRIRRNILASVLLGWLTVSLPIVCLLGLALSLSLTITPLRDVSLGLVLVVLATALVRSWITWMVNLLVTAKRPMAYLIATVGWNSLNISILWFALKQQPTLSSQVFSVFLAILLAGAALLSLNVNWFRGKPDAQIARRALILGAPIALYVIGGYLLRLSDRWIIAEFSDMTAVGLYAMAYSLGEALLLVQLAFARVWSPAFMRAESQGRNFQVEYRLAGTTIAGACSLFCLTLSLFSVEVLTLIGRASYLTAVDIMRVVLVGLLWYSTFHVTGNVLVLKEKTGLLSALTLLAGLVNLGVNFVLVPLMGAMGAAIATVLGYGLMAFLIAYAAARLYCGKLDHWRILHITLIGSGLSLLPIFFPISLPMRFFLLVLWGGILMLEMWRASREWRVSNSYQLSFLNRVTTKITQVLRGFGLHR